MALKSKEWFYKQCLHEVKQFSRLAHLSWDILEKGIGQKDSTRGHVTQAIGAVQAFLDEYPQHLSTIRTADPTTSFNVSAHAAISRDWRTWVGSKSGKYGRHSFGYDFDILKGILTPALGGTRRGGGGGDDEFKRVIRLMADFLS